MWTNNSDYNFLLGTSYLARKASPSRCVRATFVPSNQSRNKLLCSLWQFCLELTELISFGRRGPLMYLQRLQLCQLVAAAAAAAFSYLRLWCHFCHQPPHQIQVCCCCSSFSLFSGATFSLQQLKSNCSSENSSTVLFFLSLLSRHATLLPSVAWRDKNGCEGDYPFLCCCL